MFTRENMFYYNEYLRYNVYGGVNRRCNKCDVLHNGNTEFYPGLCSFCLTISDNCIISFKPPIDPYNLQPRIIHQFHADLSVPDFMKVMKKRHTMNSDVVVLARSFIKRKRLMNIIYILLIIEEKINIHFSGNILFKIANFIIG